MASTARPRSAPILYWVRQDLRLSDNAALRAAASGGRPVLAVYVLDDGTPGRWRLGGASRWWLHQSLNAFRADLEAIGGRLVFRRGPAALEIETLVQETGAAGVVWNRCYEPFATRRDAAIKASLRAAGVDVQSFAGALLREPWETLNKSGEPFKVFSPFWRACLAAGWDSASPPAPKHLDRYEEPVRELQLDDLGLRPVAPDWASGLRQTWTPGEAGAHDRLTAFLSNGLAGYGVHRNRPDFPSTSALSPHLHWGEITPRQVLAGAALASSERPGLVKDAEKLASEIGWREFSHHLLFHFPELPERNWRAAFDRFPWRADPIGLRAWRKGRTGYPIVDAGMRELWVTGWMHNRVRMIVASFLIKHLRIDWREGQDWFWDTLVDADLANNAASWQWVAGSGADAAPYFRIFNPISQGETYDPNGDYVRKWVPELAGLPTALIHRPWEASPLELRSAGVTFGETYPHPIVEHAAARAEALSAFETIKAAA